MNSHEGPSEFKGHTKAKIEWKKQNIQDETNLRPQDKVVLAPLLRQELMISMLLIKNWSNIWAAVVAQRL